MPRTKEEMLKNMISGKESVITHIILYLAKKSSRKTIGCAPSMREICTKCERSGTWILQSKIEAIENNECVNGSSSISIAAPYVNYFSSIVSQKKNHLQKTQKKMALQYLLLD